MNKKTFENSMTDVERTAWHAFVDVVRHFSGNKKAENNHDLIDNLITAYCMLGCNMSTAGQWVTKSDGSRE